MMSSFRKHNAKCAVVPGTKSSLHTGQTLISSGIPSLDLILDGGIPLGSLVVIEEDRYGDYAKLVLGYFMAEAVCNQHPLFVASLDADTTVMTSELPSPVDPPATTACSSTAPPTEQDRMTIAWRYQKLSAAPVVHQGRFGQHYDLSQLLPAAVIAAADVRHWGGDELCRRSAESSTLLRLVSSCRDHLSNRALNSVPGRAVVHALGSPLWALSTAEVVRGCQLLRAIARVTSSVVMVTVPTGLWRDAAHLSRLRRAADVCVGLESFRGTATADNPAFSDYHGLVHLIRPCGLHSLAARVPSSTDLAFKARRKKFSIETLHLPPDLSETASRAQEGDDGPKRPQKITGLCQSSKPGGPIDF